MDSWLAKVKNHVVTEEVAHIQGTNCRQLRQLTTHRRTPARSVTTRPGARGIHPPRSTGLRIPESVRAGTSQPELFDQNSSRRAIKRLGNCSNFGARLHRCAKWNPSGISPVFDYSCIHRASGRADEHQAVLYPRGGSSLQWLEMMALPTALRAMLCLAMVTVAVVHSVTPMTRVELMVAGADRVCLRPDQPEAETWVEGPQCFVNVKDELLVQGACAGDAINFCAVIPAEAFEVLGVPTSSESPESKLIMHWSVAELTTYGLHYVLVCERVDGTGAASPIATHDEMLASAGFFEKYPSSSAAGCYTTRRHSNPEDVRMKTVLTDVGFAFLLGAEHGGLNLYELMRDATEETAVKKLPASAEIWAEVAAVPYGAVTANSATRAAMGAVEDKLARPAANMRPLFGEAETHEEEEEEEEEEGEEGVDDDDDDEEEEEEGADDDDEEEEDGEGGASDILSGLRSLLTRISGATARCSLHQRTYKVIDPRGVELWAVPSILRSTAPIRTLPAGQQFEVKAKSRSVSNHKWYQTTSGLWFCEQAWVEKAGDWVGAPVVKWHGPSEYRTLDFGALEQAVTAILVPWSCHDAEDGAPGLAQVAWLFERWSRRRTSLLREATISLEHLDQAGTEYAACRAVAMLAAATGMTHADKILARTIFHPLADELGLDLVPSVSHVLHACEKELREPFSESISETTGLAGDKGAYLDFNALWAHFTTKQHFLDSLAVRREERQRFIVFAEGTTEAEALAVVSSLCTLSADKVARSNVFGPVRKPGRQPGQAESVVAFRAVFDSAATRDECDVALREQATEHTEILHSAFVITVDGTVSFDGLKMFDRAPVDSMVTAWQFNLRAAGCVQSLLHTYPIAFTLGDDDAWNQRAHQLSLGSNKMTEDLLRLYTEPMQTAVKNPGWRDSNTCPLLNARCDGGLLAVTSGTTADTKAGAGVFGLTACWCTDTFSPYSTVTRQIADSAATSAGCYDLCDVRPLDGWQPELAEAMTKRRHTAARSKHAR
eukprot:COSAG02_NODE_177_length_31154_cov_32.205152_1_plen_1006_part_10